MSICASVLIVAEVGKQVGWGHVARAQLLKSLLAPHMAVSVKVVNREHWDSPSLKVEFALDHIVDADIVFLDGLTLRQETDCYVRAPIKVSLSYISDMNEFVDHVIAPALNGMDSPSHFITDLSAMLCNNPSVNMPLHSESTIEQSKNKLIGVCMGGGDADGVAPAIVSALAERGLEAFTYPAPSSYRLSLCEFLHRKLKSKELQPFPYSILSDCRAVICQGGLSAVEFALMGMPTVIRRRTDFSDAYHFLYAQGCAMPSKVNTIPAIIDSVESVIQDSSLRHRMSKTGKALDARLDETFWLSLVNRLMRK